MANNQPTKQPINTLNQPILQTTKQFPNRQSIKTSTVVAFSHALGHCFFDLFIILLAGKGK
jgi:hypothetical protein